MFLSTRLTSFSSRRTDQRRSYAQGDSSRLEWAVRHTSPGVGRLTNYEMESGKGSWVTTVDGKKILDFSCGIGVTNTGHCHPRIVKAAQDQVAKMIHSQVNLSYHKPMLDLVERLITITPKGLDRYFFWNSGAEAIEASVKLARHATKKQNIIVFQGGYHGRTIGTMSLTTSKTIYRTGYGPLMSGVFVTPFPYWHQQGFAQNNADIEKQSTELAIKQLELIFKQQTAPSETAAVLIEPVLGEGGYVPPPRDFMKALREITTKNNVLLIADEVQTGFGRTGKWFAVDHFGVVPDILVFAKGISSGFPLSGIASTYDLMQTQPPGSMGGTFAANCVSCAVGCATIDVIKEEKLLENANARGEQLRKKLQDLKNKYPEIMEIRGLGLMIGLEFDSNKVKPKMGDALSKECAANGMLLLTTSTFETIRFIPPLNVSADEIEKGVEIFERSLKTVLQTHRA